MYSVRFSCSDEQYKQLLENSKKKGLSIQQYIRQVLFEENNETATVITVEEALKRAMQKFKPGEEFFVREIFSDEEWLTIKSPTVLGKLFYQEVKNRDDIQLVRMGRQAVYTIIKKNGGTADE